MEFKCQFGWQQESTALKHTEATKTRAVIRAKVLVEDDTAAKSSEVTPSPDANNKQHGENTLTQGNTQVYNIDLRNTSNISIAFS